MANFILCTHMTSGDVLPFLRLASALRKRGHQATLVTHGAFASIARNAGVAFRAIDSTEEYAVHMSDLHMLQDPLNRQDLFDAYQEKYVTEERLRKEYDLLVELCEKEENVIVCRERDSYAAMMVSESKQIPIVAGVLAPSYVTQLQIWDQVDFDFGLSRVNAIRKSLDLQPVASWTSWTGSVKKLIGFWHEAFDRAVEMPKGDIQAEAVGFPLADASEYEQLPTDLLAFIEAGEPPLLITGGTSKMINPAFYRASIEACKLMGRRTILVTQHEEFVHCELPDTIRWYKSLPLASVYPLVAGVIHHGGIGTATGAMAAGIPQLALAADSDRPDNGMRVKNLGVGDFLPPMQWQPDTIAQAVERVMSASVKHNCRRIAEMLEQHDTMSAACEIVESAIGDRSCAISSELLQRDYMEAERAKRTEAEKDISNRMKQISEDKQAMIAQILMKRQSRIKTGGNR